MGRAAENGDYAIRLQRESPKPPSGDLHCTAEGDTGKWLLFVQLST
jgi:hypothetical protein